VVRGYVTTTLAKEYAGACAQNLGGESAGKICSTKRGERDNLRAYILGLVASEPSEWLILQDRGGNQWSVLQSTPITGDNAGVPGIPWPLRTGVEVVVAGSAPCVNVREGPSLEQRAVDCIADGTVIRLVAGPAPADNYQWWQVEGRTGWVVDIYLRYPDAAQ
jgi:hypothetical protein